MNFLSTPERLNYKLEQLSSCNKNKVYLKDNNISALENQLNGSNA